MSYGISNAEFEQASTGLEAGYFPASITKETPVNNANGEGVYFTFIFTDGPNKGRNINSDRLYYKHSNEMTGKIARETIARISKATGSTTPLGAGQHIGRSLIIGIREKDNGYMEVFGYKRNKDAVAGTTATTSINAPF